MNTSDTEEPFVYLSNNNRLSLTAAQRCIEDAMRLIEVIGTTGIEHKHQQASDWLKKYYPERL